MSLPRKGYLRTAVIAGRSAREWAENRNYLHRRLATDAAEALAKLAVSLSDDNHPLADEASTLAMRTHQLSEKFPLKA